MLFSWWKNRRRRQILAEPFPAVWQQILEEQVGHYALLPAADRERVLKRFVRLEASRSTPGTGLGLTLVKAIADLHNARLELGDNRPGLRVTLAFAQPTPVAKSVAA